MEIKKLKSSLRRVALDYICQQTFKKNCFFIALFYYRCHLQENSVNNKLSRKKLLKS